MRNWRRVLSTMLVASMAAGMVGCGANSSNAAKEASTKEEDVKDTAEEKKDDAAAESSDVAEGTEGEDEIGQYTVLKDKDGNVYDLGGMDIVIADWWSSGEPAEPSNAYDEARQDYIDWIQKTYNFTIKEASFSTWADMPEDFVNYATSGGDENYIFTLYQGSALVSAIQSGLMYDLSTLDCLDFTEKKWQNKIYELMSKGDKIYGMRGIDQQPNTGIFFNKRLLEEAGIDPQSIYDLQESGDWTWDKFEELCQQVQKDTDNDGVIDQYAMTNFTSSLYPAAVYSNGGEFIGKNEDGTYYNDLESDETMEALNWALDMLDKYEMVYPEDAEWDYTFTAFSNGEAAFTCSETYRANDWNTNMEDDFGFVCFPKGPKADDYTNCYGDNVYVIPACYDADKAWKLAFAYNLYTDPVPGYEDYQAWKTDLYKSYRDTESVDLSVSRMMENGMITYHTMIPNLNLGSDLIWGINKDKTPAQKAEEIRNTWASYIDQANGVQ